MASKQKCGLRPHFCLKVFRYEKIALDTRHGETFEGDVLNSTLTENERLRNEVDEVIFS